MYNLDSLIADIEGSRPRPSCVALPREAWNLCRDQALVWCKYELNPYYDGGFLYPWGAY